MSLNILCVDTSTEACSVAVLCKTENDNVIHHQFLIAPREHTTKILPTVEAVLKEANIKLTDLDFVAYGRGPGSFTGVRIGISIAQGLAFGIDKKMVGVSTLQAMAQEAYLCHQVSDVYSAIDARMGEVYFSHYQIKNNLMVLIGEEVVIKPKDLIDKMGLIEEHSALVGSAWSAYPELKEFFAVASHLEIEFPSSKFMLDQAIELVNNGEAVLPENSAPVYLRDKVTWKKLPGRE